MVPYNAVANLTEEEESELALSLEKAGNDLPYLSDEDFANMSELEQERRIRMEQLNALQNHYRKFNVFLTDVMIELGFSVSKIQADIAEFMCSGGQYIMIEAQRSQAKTTIAAAFCVWTLIHDLSTVY